MNIFQFCGKNKGKTMKDGERMRDEKEKRQFQIRTDLAIEAREMVAERQNTAETKWRGVEAETLEQDDYTLTRVRITDEEGSREMGKPIGEYVTIESERLKENGVECHEEIIQLLAEELRRMAKLKSGESVLIAGLGNWNITPDALGPKVVSRILVTRHLQGSLPEEIEKTVRPVAAISPGVMGLTGIETGEIMKGLVERLKPSLLIAIDALAARRSGRINATIQMSDTGVAPGAGVGNKRMMLDRETLGIPVIAIGVPTVVDAATLVNDTMDRILAGMIRQTENGSAFYRMLQDLEQEEKYSMITEMLDPYTENMFVTPKEVDAVIDRLANIIANGINIALHPGITMEDISRYS